MKRPSNRQMSPLAKTKAVLADFMIRSHRWVDSFTLAGRSQREESRFSPREPKEHNDKPGFWSAPA